MNLFFGGKKGLFFILIFFAACQPELSLEMNPNPQYEGVDERLWKYFESFETAGKNRGYDIDIAALQITGEIKEIEEEHVAGICNFNYRSPNHVTIDLEFWDQSPEIYREMIIFHELGHCYLNQDHREAVLDRNICSSIMRSGTEECYDNYTLNTRSYYLDELFDFDPASQ